VLYDEKNERLKKETSI